MFPVLTMLSDVLAVSDESPHMRSTPARADSSMHAIVGGTDLCADRLSRYQQRNSTGRIDEVKTPGTGRAVAVHFHGEASVASMDGWAEQYFCKGETKVSAGRLRWPETELVDGL